MSPNNRQPGALYNFGNHVENPVPLLFVYLKSIHVNPPIFRQGISVLLLEKRQRLMAPRLRKEARITKQWRQRVQIRAWWR